MSARNEKLYRKMADATRAVTKQPSSPDVFRRVIQRATALGRGMLRRQWRREILRVAKLRKGGVL